jgi:hypothetical protein
MELHWSGCPVSAATYQSALLDLMGLRAGAQAVLATTLADRAGQQRSYRWVIGEGPSFGLSRTADGVEERFVPVRMTAPEVISRNLTEAFAGTGFVPARVVGVSLEVPAGSQVALEQLSYGAEMGNQVRVRNDRLEVNGHPIFVIRQFAVLGNMPRDKVVAVYDHMRDDLAANVVGLAWHARWDASRHAYSFDGVRQAAALAYSRGLFAMPDLGPPPDTDTYKAAEHQMVAANGRSYVRVDVLGENPAVQVSFCQKAVWEAHAAYLTAVVKAFRDDPSTLAWYTGDEYSYPPVDGYYSYDEGCLQGFGQWVRQKYGSLGALNRAWGSHYGDWGEVTPPREREHSAAYADWQHFRRKTIQVYFHKLYLLLHRLDPNHPVWPTLYQYLASGNRWGNWLSVSSWWDLVPDVDVVTRGITTAMMGASDALLDQIGMQNGRAVIETMHLYGHPPYSKLITVPTVIGAVFRGSLAGVSYWAYITEPTLNQDQSMVDPKTLMPHEPWYGLVSQADNLMARIAPYLYGLHVPPAQVGVLVTDLSSLYGVNMASLEGITSLFRDLQVPIRFISERNLPELSQCKVLVIGDEAKVWDSRLTSAIQHFISTGGYLIVNGHPARWNSRNEELSPPEVREIHALFEEDSTTGNPAEPVALSPDGRVLRIGFSISKRYTPFGHLAVSLDQSLDGLRGSVRKFLNAAGVSPRVEFETKVSPQPTIEVRELVGNSHDIVAVMNYMPDQVTGRLKLKLASGDYRIVSLTTKSSPRRVYPSSELAAGINATVPAYGVLLLELKQ